MRCPKCLHDDSFVIDSRSAENGRVIRRRRECKKCHARFTTFERVEFVSFFVIKANGKKEMYDRGKLELSIYKACNKRGVGPEKIETMVNALELQWARNKTGVKTKTIGRDVMKALKDIDEVAYIRFASVYENFHSVRDFTNFMSNEF